MYIKNTSTLKIGKSKFTHSQIKFYFLTKTCWSTGTSTLHNKNDNQSDAKKNIWRIRPELFVESCDIRKITNQLS